MNHPLPLDRQTLWQRLPSLQLNPVTMHALQTAREQLELPEGFCIRCNSPHLHSVTCYSRGVFHAQDTQSPLLAGLPYCHRLGNNGSVANEEVARYYAARLLVSPRDEIEAAMQLPFSTYHETYIPESETYTCGLARSQRRCAAV